MDDGATCVVSECIAFAPTKLSVARETLRLV